MSSDKQYNTDTNMLISTLANPERLNPPEKIVHYEDLMNDHDILKNDAIESCFDNNNANDEHNDVDDNNDTNAENVHHTDVRSETEKEDKKNNSEDDEYDEYDNASPIRKKLLKLDILRKLAELVKKGVRLTQNYNMDSDYHLMKFEYELHKGVREKHNMVKMLQDGCISTIGALEKANKKYDPFGLELDGWCDNVSCEDSRLYDTFGDLYDKWNKPGKSMPPELALVGIIGLSAAKTHFVNASTDTIPTIEEQQKQDPLYLEKIRQQALGNTLDGRKQPNTFDDKLTQQYQENVKQISDFKKIRDMEEAQLKMQQRMTPPSFNPMMKQNINLGEGLRDPTTPNMTRDQYLAYREKEISEHRRQMEKNMRNVDTESVKERSNIDKIIEDAEMQSNKSISKMRRKRKGKKNNAIHLNLSS
jgi:hypothetical protein